MKRQARPHGPHGAHGERRTQRVEADAGMAAEDVEDGAQQCAVAALEVALHAGQQGQHGDDAQQHHAASPQIDGAPSRPQSHRTAHDTREEDAREQAGEHDADVARLVLGTGILTGNGDEQLGHHGAGAQQQRGAPHGPDAAGGGNHQRSDARRTQADGDDAPVAVEVGHGRDEEQAQDIAQLGGHGDAVGLDDAAAQVVAHHLEQRLVVVEVGDGDARHDGHHQEDAARYALVALKSHERGC